MKEKKEIKFSLEPIDKKDIPDSLKIKPVKVNKIVIPRIEPVKNIRGYRLDKLQEKHVKVDETEIEYLKKILTPNANYIQDIYKKMRNEELKAMYGKKKSEKK